MKQIKAKFAKGAIGPLEPLDIEEGEEVLLTLEDAAHASVGAEDAALARAIADGLTTKPVSKRRVLAVLRDRGGRLGV